MRVHINGDLFAECLRVDGFWNGWACPVFSRDQMDAVIEECDRLGWEGEVDENGDPAWRKVRAERFGDDDGWVCDGWVWEICDGE
jgi:hypothetical protein